MLPRQLANYSWREQGRVANLLPKEQKVCSRRGCVADSTVPKFNFKYLQGTTPRRGLVPRQKCRNSEIYFYFIKESI
ncbi:hypothetical protein MTR67_026132 [Solanum verrucosum]|uniref:Uncharacterized protein n=1 Tax=Solanum verrucosum TaxID=315347 RepID=A0AAF0R2D4_SOLVR|nr:hypothetical protein MTR67_026132 [Solanum verrucosum]